MNHVVRIPLAVVRGKLRGAEMLEAGRIVGDALELDYAVFAARFRNPPLPAYDCLAGSELKALLGRLGINAEPGCACESRANEMDRNGCDWCEANIPTIVGWLREEATKRGLPFVDVAGTVLVKRAISNARRLHRGKAHG
jgi:hypothetical protein